MKRMYFSQHLEELIRRAIALLVCFLLFAIMAYIKKDLVYDFAIKPLLDISSSSYDNSVIYTNLTEAFFTYIKLSCFVGFICTVPFLYLQLYLFIAPALNVQEILRIKFLFVFSIILFFASIAFVFFCVIPKAWVFFVGFTDKSLSLPILLMPKISEYVNLILQFITAFAIAFQLPIGIIILNMLSILDYHFLIKKRKIAIVIIFIIAGIFTPPDILSQFALAIPMILLYEVSVVICKFFRRK